jgi:hypothetical protein
LFSNRYEGAELSELRAAHCEIPAMQRRAQMAISPEYLLRECDLRRRMKDMSIRSDALQNDWFWGGSRY